MEISTVGNKRPFLTDEVIASSRNETLVFLSANILTMENERHAM